jgi:hypothetical protein
VTTTFPGNIRLGWERLTFTNPRANWAYKKASDVDVSQIKLERSSWAIYFKLANILALHELPRLFTRKHASLLIKKVTRFYNLGPGPISRILP